MMRWQESSAMDSRTIQSCMLCFSSWRTTLANLVSKPFWRLYGRTGPSTRLGAFATFQRIIASRLRCDCVIIVCGICCANKRMVVIPCWRGYSHTWESRTSTSCCATNPVSSCPTVMLRRPRNERHRHMQKRRHHHLAGSNVRMFRENETQESEILQRCKEGPKQTRSLARVESKRCPYLLMGGRSEPDNVPNATFWCRDSSIFPSVAPHVFSTSVSARC
mmetsp:Transcript_29431/g.68103  ORF Transcript_29431/g.68103 Transcript_29431/m.68103 type:complete len:220 (-) Transcript_29431:51-710(-)